MVLCPHCNHHNPDGARTCLNCRRALAIAAGPTPATPPPSNVGTSTVAGQKRLVTVLYCTTHTPAPFAQRFEEEKQYLLERAIMKLLAQAVDEFEGHVDHLSSQGMVALFGVPIMQENHAERALRTALSLQERLQVAQERFERRYGSFLEVRMGINSGTVIATTRAGTVNLGQMVVGDTVAFASALAQAAAAGTILASAATYQLTERLCEFQPQPVSLPDRAEPAAAYQLVGVRPESDRQSSGASLPMIGRQELLAQLVTISNELSKHQQPQIVMLTGAAGVGKSRLLAEFRGKLAQSDSPQLAVHHGSCQAHASARPYGIVANMLRQMAGINEYDSLEGQYRDLTLFLESLALNRDQVHPFLAYLLGLAAVSPTIEARLALFDADMLQKLIHNAVRQLTLALGLQSPLILIFEDIQWVDRASLNLLSHLLNTTDDLPILYIFTSREPEAEHALNATGPITRLHLPALTTAEGRLLAEQLVGPANGANSDLIEQIVKRAGGNPFFMEEIVRMLGDDVAAAAAGDGQLAASQVQTLLHDVPGTLQALILARLDRLDSYHRQTLEKAAVVGTTFSDKLLQALDSLPQETVKSHLEYLIYCEFIDPDPQEEGYFRFRHDLVQEILYGAMLRRQRQALHEQVATVLEVESDELKADRVELLAHHYSQSPVPQKAIPYLLQVADAAAQRMANETAVAHYQRVVDLVSKQPAGGREFLFRAKIGLGKGHKYLGDYDKAHAVLSEMLPALLSWSIKADQSKLVHITTAAFGELADIQIRKGNYGQAISHLEAGIDALGDNAAQTYPTLYRFLTERVVHTYFRQGKLVDALALAQSAVASVTPDEAPDPAILANLYSLLGGISWQQGNLKLAINYVRQCLRLHEKLDYPYGMANAYNNLGVLSWQQGNWNQAIQYWSRGLAVQLEIGDKHNIALGRLNLGQLHLQMGNFDQAENETLAALGIARQANDSYSLALAYAMLGQHALLQKQAQLAQDYALEAIALADQIGGQITAIEGRWVKALAQAELGDVSAGLATVNQALEMAKTSGLVSEEANCLRVTGILLAQSGKIVAAETNLRESLELCRQTDDPHRHGLALLELGQLYQMASRFDEEGAAEQYHRSLAAIKEALTIFSALGAAHDQQLAESVLEFLQTNPPRPQQTDSDFDQAQAQTEAVPGQRYKAAILWLDLTYPAGADEEAVFEIAAFVLPAIAAITQEHGGYVRQRSGGLTASFGVPTAYEDDTERAVQAAYSIWSYAQQAANQFEVPFGLKVVVSSGTVIAGQAIDAYGQRPVPGREADFVIRGSLVDQTRQAAAAVPANQVWVTETVRVATERLFSYQPDPVTELIEASLWALAAPRQAPDPARGLPGVQTRFVGRDASLQAMVKLKQNLAEGIGGIAWIEGEAGIGKSRLMREFNATLSAEECLVLNGGCSPQHVNHAFYLISDLLRSLFDWQRTDSSDQVRRKIEKRLSAWPEDSRATQPYLETLAGIKPAGLAGERLARLEPEQLRQQIFVAVRRLVISLTRQQPLVVFLDDLHWIDPVSAELLQFMVTAVSSVPILFVCAQRREGSDSPNDRLLRLYSLLPGQTVRIMLDRLPPEISRLLLSDLLPGADLSPDLQESIVVRSEGNPYFIEEFVRMFIELGHVQKVGEKWQLAAERVYDPATIPASLQTLIRSRIDALPAELKETLEYAAILGQTFEISLLASVTDNANTKLLVERLASRLMLAPVADSNRWHFSHALYESIVYESMLKVQRRQRHHRVARLLQQLWAAETGHAQELAYHYMRADEQAKALPYLIEAGDQAAGQYAIEEALGYYRQASDILAQLDRPNAEWQRRLAVGLGEAYRFVGQYEESLAALQTGLDSSGTAPLRAVDRATLYRRMGQTARKQGDLQAAHDYLVRAEALLTDLDDPPAIAELAHVLNELAWVYFSQGQFSQTLETCEQSLAYAQAADGLNELATAHNLLGGVYYQLGEWREAFHHTTRAMILREQLGYSWGVASTLSNLGILAFVAGNWHKSVSFFERSLALRQEIGDVEGIAITQNNLGNAYRGQGNLEQAENCFRESIVTARTFNIAYHLANSQVGLAHVLLLQGQVAEAEEYIDKGTSRAEEIGAQDILAEARRVQAEIMLASSAPEKALPTAEQAAALAAAAGNRSYEVAAWRVAARAALAQNALPLAETLIQKAAALLSETTDHLEAGHVAAQAYQIYSRSGQEQLARENLAAAREAYNRLGAVFYLSLLDQVPAGAGDNTSPTQY